MTEIDSATLNNVKTYILNKELEKYFTDIYRGEDYNDELMFNYRRCPYTWILEHLIHSDENRYYYCRRKAIERPLNYGDVYMAAKSLGLKESSNLLYHNIAHPDFNPNYKSKSDKPSEGFYFNTPSDYKNEVECDRYKFIWNVLREKAYNEIKPILDLWVKDNNQVMRFPLRTCDGKHYLLERYANEQK